jgi:hypothetical protein
MISACSHPCDDEDLMMIGCVMMIREEEWTEHCIEHDTWESKMKKKGVVGAVYSCRRTDRRNRWTK